MFKSTRLSIKQWRVLLFFAVTLDYTASDSICQEIFCKTKSQNLVIEAFCFHGLVHVFIIPCIIFSGIIF